MRKEEDPIEQMLRSQGRGGQRVTLANLRNKNNKQPELDDEMYDRIQKLKRNALNDSMIPTQKLNNYYCSLCGRIVFVTNILLQNMDRRRTDNSISIELIDNFIRLSLDREKVKYLKRQTGIETQYRWKCECGITIGYTSITYDQFDQLKPEDRQKLSNRPYFYVYDGAVVQKMKQSKLISEIITYKQTILLHLKRKNKK